MKKLLLAAVALGALTLARPAPADAHFSLAIGLPGFGLFVQEPLPPPVVYTAPVYYRPPVYYAPAYYAPAPVVVRAHCHRDHGHHHGWYKHHRDWD